MIQEMASLAHSYLKHHYMETPSLSLYFTLVFTIHRFVILESASKRNLAGLNFFMMLENGCLFYLLYYCDVYLSLLFNLSVMSIV